MSLQGASDAPFAFRCGLPVATKAPILVILSKCADPVLHSIPQFTEQWLLYLIRFVFDPQRRIPFSPSRHLVMTPRCMCAVLISIAKRAHAVLYVHSLSCLALDRPSQTLLSLLYEVLAALLSTATFSVP